MKKLLNIILVLIMMISIVPVKAATTGSITIDNAVKGETYTVYKMLNIKSMDSTGKKVSYEVVEGWNEFFIKKGFEITTNNLISKGDLDNVDMATFAKEALAYAEKNNIASVDTKEANSTTVEFTGLALGYYLVDTTVGTLCAINNVTENVTIKDKNPLPDIEKTIDETQSDTNNAKIGDTIDYTAVVSNIANKSNVKVSDTMTEGLTLNKNSIKVTVGGTDVNSENYELTSATNSFNIKFEDAYIESLNKEDKIVIKYNATLNEKAVIAGNGNVNTIKLTYGNKQEKEDKTITYTYKMTLEKVDEEKNTLTGAKFELSKDGQTLNVVKVDNGYRLANGNEAAMTTVIEAGLVDISGLENGTYTLTETEAPEGYNRLGGPVTFEIKDANYNGNFKVVNTTGAVLPSTGGMGTILFVTIGSIMALACGVVLVTKFRMAKELA